VAASVDVLMITYQRPQYVRLSLDRLLSSCDDDTRVWLWHNGDDAETLSVARSFADHPRVHRFHHSERNVSLREPTNWLWRESDGDLVSKVDDDCLVDPHWLGRLRETLDGAPQVGVVGSWRFYDEDFDERALRKVVTLPNGQQMMRHPWVQGSGYLARREVVDELGPIRDDESFTQWCIRAARRGRTNGWAYPFVHEEHMDDPRSPWTIYTDDEAFLRWQPLSARTTGVDTLEAWTAQMRESARILQTWPADVRHYIGWRQKLRNLRRRVRKGW